MLVLSYAILNTHALEYVCYGLIVDFPLQIHQVYSALLQVDNNLYMSHLAFWQT